MDRPNLHVYAADQALRTRARAVIPGGMYGHRNAGRLPDGFPQFLERAKGCRLIDVDGNEYIDFMCSYGPIVLGHGHAEVDAAAARQQALGDCQNGPSPRMFEKNGTDATTKCVTIARAATGRRKILVATGSYHGSAPWCTPNLNGITDENRAHLIQFAYNDVASVERAVEAAGDDLAGIIVTAFRHDNRVDQELPSPAFARRLRALCDER